MKYLTNALLIFGTFALMLLLIWGMYLGVTFVINQFEMFDARETAIVTVSSLVVLISSLIIATSIRSSIQKGDKKIHPEKARLYTRYLEVYELSKKNSKDFDKQVEDLNRHMILWAGDEVLKEYGQLLKMIDNGDEDIQAQATNVLLEIRKDIGHKNRGVNFELISGK
jgi:hypothetical protein